jgi:putative transposase
MPLSTTNASANTHDMKATFDTLDGVVVQRRRPSPSPCHRQHLSLDKGYDFPEIEEGIISRKYVPHMRHRGEIEYPVNVHPPAPDFHGRL